jgi:hypothetical protein
VTITAPPTLFAPFADLDWGDLAAVTTASTVVLDQLAADRPLLGEQTVAVIDDAHLASLCEHYDILDKLVLHDDPDGWRIRLHVFSADYFDRPHNHRWTYTSRILTGSYTHVLYGTDHDFTHEVDVAALTPRLVRIEEPGDTYTLHHSMIHSVTAHGEVVTLIVRGPKGGSCDPGGPATAGRTEPTQYRRRATGHAHYGRQCHHRGALRVR